MAGVEGAILSQLQVRWRCRAAPSAFGRCLLPFALRRPRRACVRACVRMRAPARSAHQAAGAQGRGTRAGAHRARARWCCAWGAACLGSVFGLAAAAAPPRPAWPPGRLTRACLCLRQSGDIDNTLDFATKSGFDHNAVIGALKSLVADNYVTMVAEDHEAYKLLAEGEKALKDGSPEAQVYKVVKDDGSTKEEIEQLAGALAKVGLSQCMQAKWLKIDKDKGGKIFKEVAAITDAVQDQLKIIEGGKLPPKADVDKLKKRKMIADAKYKTYKVPRLACLLACLLAAHAPLGLTGRAQVSKGAEYAPVRTKAAADITMEMMMDGSWKKQKFKPYNFDALGQDPQAGRLHPLLKVCVVWCRMSYVVCRTSYVVRRTSYVVCVVCRVCRVMVGRAEVGDRDRRVDLSLCLFSETEGWIV